MYLSQIVLDLVDKRTERVLSDVYRLHQFVMSGFSTYEQPSRILFRLEPEVRGNVARLLVQSQVKPAWGEIDGERKATLNVQTKKFVPQFSEAARYRFRLRANPTVTREKKRYGLIRDEALFEWLKRKEAAIGASFRSVCAIDEGYVVGTGKMSERVDKIAIKTARFEGWLEIREPATFNQALSGGIGSAKAFGCGLLSVARA